MIRTDLLTQAAQALTKIRLLEKKIIHRKPKVEKAASDLLEARKEALRKVDEEHRRRTGKLLAEVAEIERELSLLRKRYVELQSDVVRVSDKPPETR